MARAGDDCMRLLMLSYSLSAVGLGWPGVNTPEPLEFGDGEECEGGKARGLAGADLEGEPGVVVWRTGDVLLRPRGEPGCTKSAL